MCKCFVMFCGLCHMRLPTFLLSYQRPLRLGFLSSTTAHFLSHMLKYGGTMFILYKKCGWTYCLSGLATKLLDWHKLQRSRLTDIKEVCTGCVYSSHSSIPLQQQTCFIWTCAKKHKRQNYQLADCDVHVQWDKWTNWDVWYSYEAATVSNSWLHISGRLATVSGFNYNFRMAAISSYSVSYVHQIFFYFFV